MGQTEITGLTTIDWQPMWRETTLLTDRAVQLANDKYYVFSDPVLCLGGISTEPVKHGKARLNVFGNTLSQRFGSNPRRTNGIRVENVPRIYCIVNSL